MNDAVILFYSLTPTLSQGERGYLACGIFTGHTMEHRRKGSAAVQV